MPRTLFLIGLLAAAATIVVLGEVEPIPPNKELSSRLTGYMKLKEKAVAGSRGPHLYSRDRYQNSPGHSQPGKGYRRSASPEND